MSKTIFVTASGTEVGKTLVSCALAHQARAAGKSVRVLKPVATGFEVPAETDTGLLLAAAGQEMTDANIDACTPWRFGPAIAPDMAAARAGAALDFHAIVSFCREGLQKGADLTVIEGVGGTLVPLGGAHTVRDLIAALGIPAIVVTGSYLGAISHTLTALESLQARNIDVRALIVSESEDAPVPLTETVDAITQLTDVPIITVPRLRGARAWEHVPDLSEIL